MANLRDIKRRIRSVKNTQQITKAMKLVSASKLRKAQEKILNVRPYAVKLMEALQHLAARCNHDMHPLLEDRQGNRTLLLVIASDKGLCGAFNSNILRKTAQVLREKDGDAVSFIAAGRKGRDFLRARKYNIQHEYIGWAKGFDYLKAAEIGDILGELYARNAVDKIYVVYNEFKSVIQQQVVLEQLLPIVPEAMPTKGREAPVSYIYEPDEESILDHLLKRYLTVEVFRAFLESAASEHGARMTAMDNATRNASEMIGGLTLFYNRTRQAYITKELIEVVNGAEALKG
ncbi:MAG: ATP synthase F1 subunit gamma [Nitrospinae bacterium]|nr:ATP synthase F1 subunit gamma [Nitrospinota bacterium]